MLDFATIGKLIHGNNNAFIAFLVGGNVLTTIAGIICIVLAMKTGSATFAFRLLLPLGGIGLVLAAIGCLETMSGVSAQLIGAGVGLFEAFFLTFAALAIAKQKNKGS